MSMSRCLQLIGWLTLVTLTANANAEPPQLPPSAFGVITEISEESIVVADQVFFVNRDVAVVDRRGIPIPFLSLQLQQSVSVYAVANDRPDAPQIVKRIVAEPLR